ncbi:hypothetical protein ILYODFUR_033308 [Ilyodon furcidens]|uniref:Uncharacterized protein n=1 Tax=Ilyodon furcidens TaxID=33524 RepID=A0ABV0UZI8_9TELE
MSTVYTEHHLDPGDLEEFFIARPLCDNLEFPHGSSPCRQLTFSVLVGGLRSECFSSWSSFYPKRYKLQQATAFKTQVALWSVVSFVFFLSAVLRFSVEFSSGQFAGQFSTVMPWQYGLVLRPAGKFNQYLHRA